MEIERVFLGGVELSRERADEVCAKYLTTLMALECFFGGLEIETPEGVLIADVKKSV